MGNVSVLFSLFLQGGGPCVFTFTPGLPPRVTSVFAKFEGLDTQELDFSRRGWLGFFPGL